MPGPATMLEGYRFMFDERLGEDSAGAGWGEVHLARFTGAINPHWDMTEHLYDYMIITGSMHCIRNR